MGLMLANLLFASVLYAYSGPDRIIPAPVEYSISEGVYRLECDGSDVKVHLSSRDFLEKIDGLPDFAKEEAYELTIGKKRRKLSLQNL